MTSIAKVVAFHTIDESDVGKLLGPHVHVHTQRIGKGGPCQ